MAPNGGSTKVPGVTKMNFSKVVPKPHGMLKQVFLIRLEPVVMHFGPWKIPKCLENGPFGTENGAKARFFKSDRGPCGVHKQVK